jgi:hypothetical protein
MKISIVASALRSYLSNTAIAADARTMPATGASVTADTPTAHNTRGVNNIPGGMIGPNESEVVTGHNTLGVNDLLGGIAKNERHTPGIPWGIKQSDVDAWRQSSAPAPMTTGAGGR